VIFFEKIFSLVLDASIQEAVTWNTGIHQLYSAKPLVPKMPKDLIDSKFRHRKVIQDPGFRKHPQTVPTMHQPDMNITPAEMSVKNNGGRKILSQDEIQKICSKYHISRLNAEHPRKLGNTGMILSYDPELRGYILHK